MPADEREDDGLKGGVKPSPSPLSGSFYVERGAGGDPGGGDDEVQDQHCGSGEADAEEPGAAVLYDGVHDVLQTQASHC